MKRLFSVLLLLVFLVAFASIVTAHENHSHEEDNSSELPIGLQKIIESNQQQTLDFSVKISFFIAFVAGILGILSPCILPFLPAYFSYTFKEKKNITKMTLVFFVGFAVVFVVMGIIAGFIGERSLSILQSNWLVTVAGAFLILMGFVSISGKGFASFIKPNRKFNNDILGTLLFGVFFAIGWTACLGPILAGILGIGALLHNIFYSAMLLLFYSIGNLVPLFVLSMLYDKFDLSKSRFIKGKMFKFKIDDKTYHIHSTNLIAGILFLFIGIILLIFKGTSVFNSWDLFGTKQYFYSIQNALIGWQYANLLSIILFLIFILIVGIFLWKRHKKNKS